MDFHSVASFVVTCCISSRVNLALGPGCTASMMRGRWRSQKTRYAVRARLGGFTWVPSSAFLCEWARR